MEFTAIVSGDIYRFTSLNKSSFLVTGNHNEYILYKSNKWNCADDITVELVIKMGETIDEHLHVLH
jgi:hypothetical protein